MRKSLLIVVAVVVAFLGCRQPTDPTDEPSDDATLSALVLSAGVLDPAFDPATTAYAVSADFATETLSVTPTATHDDAAITVDGVAVESGTASGDVALLAGETVDVTIVVTAEDGETTTEYTVSVARADEERQPLPSDDASLSALVVSDCTLSPAFSVSTLAYSSGVDFAIASVTVTPTAADSGATIQINSAAVDSGTPSAAIALAAGDNTITVTVTAEDTTTTATYTVDIARSVYEWGAIWETLEAGATVYAAALSPAPGGGVYAMGSYKYTVDFDPGPGEELVPDAGSSYDLFVTRLSSEGTHAWTWAAGAGGIQVAYGGCVDQSGNPLITGYFEGAVDFDPDGPGDPKTAVAQDVFLTKLLADGSYGWTLHLSGGGWDEGDAVATDEDGDVFLLGSTDNSLDVDPHPVDVATVDSGGTRDLFVAKYDGNDGSYLWHVQVGGDNTVSPVGIACTSSYLYVAGSFKGTANFAPSGTPENRASTGDFDGFLLILNASDGSYVEVFTFGGGAGDTNMMIGLSVDNTGNIYVSGRSEGTLDFEPDDTDDGVYSSGAAGQTNAFVTRINSDHSYGWTAMFVSALHSRAMDVLACSDGSIVVSGYFLNDTSGIDLDPGTGTDVRFATGDAATYWDAFVVRLAADRSYLWGRTLGGTQYDYAYCAAEDEVAGLYLAGSIQTVDTTEYIDIDPTEYTDEYTSQAGTGGNTGFIIKIHE